jgi:hypothetical protein
LAAWPASASSGVAPPDRAAIRQRDRRRAFGSGVLRLRAAYPAGYVRGSCGVDVASAARPSRAVAHGGARPRRAPGPTLHRPTPGLAEDDSLRLRRRLQQAIVLRRIVGNGRFRAHADRALGRQRQGPEQ